MSKPLTIEHKHCSLTIAGGIDLRFGVEIEMTNAYDGETCTMYLSVEECQQIVDHLREVLDGDPR